jgi:hypothetical protein
MSFSCRRPTAPAIAVDSRRAWFEASVAQNGFSSNQFSQLKKMLGSFGDDQITFSGEQQHNRNHTARRRTDAAGQGVDCADV